MIDNIHQASGKLTKSYKVMMDLGDPKLRTGSMRPGPEIIYIKPEKDVTGKIVLRKLLHGNAENHINTININNLKQGVYFLKLQTTNSNRVIRFIKQ